MVKVPQNRKPIHLDERGLTHGIKLSIRLRATFLLDDQATEFEIPEHEVIRIGRAPKHGCRVAWDVSISREHADVNFSDGLLKVSCLPKAGNSILYNQQKLREVAIPVGQQFRIGMTRFHVIDTDKASDAADGEAEYFEEHTYSKDELRGVIPNAEKQIVVLTRLPQLIAAAGTDEDLAVNLAGQLLMAIPWALAVAVVRYDTSGISERELTRTPFLEPALLQVHTRDDFTGTFKPSRRLLSKTLNTKKSVVHIWGANPNSQQYSVCEGLPWAFATNVPSESSDKWCLYVSGKGSRQNTAMASENDLKPDVRFTELVAEFIGSVRRVRHLQDQATQMSSFFSPKVVQKLTTNSVEEALKPAMCNITVLFCDVRGFSKKSEQLQGDLMVLLRTMKAALGVMASGILDHDGTIADFQGDAALGFWGWPVDLEEGPILACRAALRIYQEFELANQRGERDLTGFSVGLGISHGRALAGQIGTLKQSKVGVFGPVVNQGARLEGMTKMFGVPICIDDKTAKLVKQLTLACHVRPLAKVYPKGMSNPVMVHGLLPIQSANSEPDEQLIADHEEAVYAIIRGDWSDAAKVLSSLPDDDGPSRFLKQFLAEQGDKPGPDWDGCIHLKAK